jgi:predicted metal-dependent phosphoesterase TrpH
MRRLRVTAWIATLLGIAAGTLADRPIARPPLMLGGYRVLAADFHVHSSTWSDGTLTPFGLVLEAEHQGLDVIAITGHNQVSDSRAGRWFSEHVGGPLVLTGEEIHTIGHHVIAVGISRTIDFRLPVASQLDETHEQGGVAIAAHPTPTYAPAFNGVLDRLDGAEICHPVIYAVDDGQQQLERFSAEGHFAAIGSSDFHGFSRLGLCRTYVFATDPTAAAVLDALRARRTVVYGLGGRAYGDPELIRLAESVPRLRTAASTDAPASSLDWLSRVAGVFGLASVVLAQRRWA